MLTAEEKIHQREYELFVALREQVAAQTGRLLQTAEVLATLDVLAALAELAASRAATAGPSCATSRCWTSRDGRHPVLDQTLPPGTFVPNDVRLGPDDGRFLAHHRTEHGRQKRLHPPGRAR